MNRRSFIAGSTTGFVLLGGCVGGGTSGSEPSPTDGGTTEPASTEPSEATTTTSSPAFSETVTDTPSSTEDVTTTTKTELIPEDGTDAEITTVKPESKINSSDGSTRQEKTGACNGARYLSFYDIRDGFTDALWGPSTVRVAFGLGGGGNVRLVVLENDVILGTTQVLVPEGGYMHSDGEAIPLDTALSDKHTIRVVMYPATGVGEFSLDGAIPCQHEGEPVRTELRTIDFSRFSPNT